jgi:hypothetical protein
MVGLVFGHPDRPILVRMVASVFALLSSLGLLTGIGLFGLKRWARLSLLTFASVLAYVGASSLINSFVFLLPTVQQDSIGRAVALSMFSLVLIAGLGWLYFFSRPSVAAQFPAAAKISPRPLSITVIAVLLIGGALVVMPAAFFGLPAAVFGIVLTGLAALGVNLALGSLGLVLGFGLLRLSELSRRIAIGYLVYSMIGVFPFLLPGSQARVAALIQHSPVFFEGASTPPMNAGALWLMQFQGMALLAAFLWFLITRKNAFTKPTAEGPKQALASS